MESTDSAVVVDNAVHLGRESTHHGKDTAGRAALPLTVPGEQNQRAQEKRNMHDTKGDAPDGYVDQVHDEKHHKTNEQKKEDKKQEHEAQRHDRLHKASDYAKE